VTPTPARIPARTPPELPGLDRSWSRIVTITDTSGALPDSSESRISVHVLDTDAQDGSAEPAELTVVCVHGNPTWSYLWRDVLAQAPPNVRVIAVDQVGMGFSGRGSRTRRLGQRIDDLSLIVEALEVSGPVVAIAHDWGGPVALGWVQKTVANPESPYWMAGVVLTNTAVHQPEHRMSPRLIAAARHPWILGSVTRRTTGFLRGTTAISTVDSATARAFRAPYATAVYRQGIEDFVADIPLEINHPSRPTLDRIARDMEMLRAVPALLVWGMKDPVFSVRYLDDLRRRLPEAEVQQYAKAGHLVLEDSPEAIAEIWSWIDDLIPALQPEKVGVEERTSEVVEDSTDLLGRLRSRVSSSTAISQPVGKAHDTFRDVTWEQLDDRVQRLASAFSSRGVAPDDRVAVLITPGADLLAVVYAVWSIGASIVVIDAAHGVKALWQSLRAARLDHIVAMRHAAPVVRLLRVPGQVIWSDELAAAIDGVVVDTRVEFATDARSDAAIVFTSGATGAAKPVAYSREKIAATRDLLLSHYRFTDDDTLVAAFAPWAVLGPLLGIASVIPSMDPSRPGTLTATALTEAMEHAGGTVMWMSPAALRSVLSGARSGTVARTRLREAGSNLKLLLLAGAPVSATLLRDVCDLWPQCEVRTPYGMTEVLPATDVTAAEVLDQGAGRGVLVGRPLPGVELGIAPLDQSGRPGEDLSTSPGVLGEVAISAPHAKDRYDSRAFVERNASRNRGWHRTGDIGLFDDEGRLWLEGRLGHVIATADGPIGPVSVEQTIEAGLEETITAVVGVGPVGAQVVAVVCAPAPVQGSVATSRLSTTLMRSQPRLRLANPDITDRVRTIADGDPNLPPIAAVLWIDRMPVDIRHGAKIDRSQLAALAESLLAGHS
jgi:acyl-coenzyme A synthetase/AMP-(fatty) acid ligase/pimeloyl-ACP methyl ester carboxylesterase